MKTEPDTRPSTVRTRKDDVERRAKGRLRIEGGILTTILISAAYTIWTIFGHGGTTLNQVVSDWTSPIVATMGTVWSVWGVRARLKARKDAPCDSSGGRLSANLLTLSIAAYGFAAAIWAYTELALHESPFPSWADAGYVMSAVSLAAGVSLLPHRPLPGAVRVRVLLDSLMIMAALVTFSWFFVLGPTILNSTESLLTKVLSAFYPVIDLVLLFSILTLTANIQERAVVRVRNLLCVGVLAYVVSDVNFGYLSLKELYQAGHPLDAGWMIANLLMGQAVLTLRNQRATGASGATTSKVEHAPRLWRTLLPYGLLPAVGALVVYVWQEKLEGGLSTGVYVGAGVLTALILVRQVFAIAENSRLYRFLQEAYRELEAHASTDVMTGLPNHRVFQERLRDEVEVARANEQQLTLLLIDVDRFKAYNDNFGHPAGDEALRIVGCLLKENVRTRDLAARYGGEEFAVILPSTPLSEAHIIAERIRTACEATPFPHRQVTLSIGIASGDDAAGTLIEGADRALYAAKHAGRNRVAVERRTLEIVQGDASPELRGLPEGWSLTQARARGVERLRGLVLSGPTGPLLKAVLAMLDLRDHDVERHSDRVTRFCLRLADEAARRGVTRPSSVEQCDLYLGALLHDVGKVGVPDAILHKPGALNAEEWDIVRRHPIQGAELLAEIPELAGAIPVVRSHHERWDGTGYPDGLVGERIPIGARIFALADSLDAMWSDRPYRKAMEFSAIRDEVCRMSGSQFQPALVDAFLAISQAEWEELQTGNAEAPLREAA